MGRGVATGAGGAALLLWLAAGCAARGEQPLDRVMLRASRPRTIAMVRRATPAPGYPKLEMCHTPRCNENTLRIVAGWVNSARSLEVRNDNAIEDPAVQIGEALLAAMSKKYSLQRVEGVVALAPVTLQEISGPNYPQADLLLAIATTGWGFGPIGRGQSHVSYRGTLELIDRRTRTVVARGVCTFDPLPSEDDPLYDDMVANNAALLKEELHAAAETCSDQYRLRILGIFQ